MATTVRVEIPISATDNTAGGVSSAQRRFDRLERSADKMQRKLDKMNRTRVKVSIDADESASTKIANVDDALQKTNGRTAHVGVDADTNAVDQLNDVDDALNRVNGSSATVTTEADGSAEDQLNDVDDKLAELNGSGAVVTAETDGNAVDELSEVSDAADALNGRTVVVEVQVADNASEQLSEIMEEASGGGGNTGGGSGGGLGGNFGTAAAVGMAKAPIAGAAAVMGASFGVYDSVSTFASFEEGMSRVQAISGATGADLQMLTDKAKQMGATTKFTATQSAEAFNYMAMAGWKTEEMMEGIEGIMNLSAASGEDLGTTSDIVTDVLTAFGKTANESTHFADVMAQASANANTNVSMLGESFKYVGPVAGALGYTIEDTALALGLMANAGVKSSMAGTSLRRAISNLTSPTDKQKAAMDKYNISLTNQDGSMKSLGDVMGDLRTNLRGLDKDEQTAAVSTMFGSQAMAGMLAIVNASTEDYAKLSDAVGTADGAAQEMSETMMDNLQGSFTLMQSAIESVEDELGGKLSPYFRGLADNITAAMPTAISAIDNLFADIDSKVQTMTLSKEWKEADFFGKVDIAWDTLIADPFKEWVNSTGYETIGGALSTLFSKAANVFTGDGSVTDWASLGLVALGFEKIATGVGSMSAAIEAFPGVGALEGITGLTGMIGPAVVAAVGVGAAIWSIKTAIDHYNQLKIENNLADHFGDLSLSAEQAEALAGQIVPIEGITAELHVAEVAFDESESLQMKAEAKLAEINTLQWKLTNVTFDTSEMDLEALASSSEELRDILIEKMQKDEEGSEAFVKAILGEGPEASQITGQLATWFDIDTEKIDSISNSVKSILENSINEGAESVETATAVSILQTKMMELASGAKADELQGKLDWLNITSSGAALTPESWADTTTQIGNLVQEFMQADAEEYSNFLGVLRGLERNDPKRKETIDGIRQIIADAQGELMNTSTLQGWNWMYGSLNQAYGDEIQGGRGIMESHDYLNEWLNGTGSVGTVQGESQMFGREFGADTQGALLDRYEKMMPTVDALKSIIDNATEPVPQAIMDAYNEAMELGAMAGDEGAMSQFYANQLTKGFDNMDDFQKMLEDNGIDFTRLSEQFQEELTRALTETTEDKDYSGIMDSLIESLAGEDIDWNTVSSILEEAGYDISEALQEQGIDVGDQEVPVEGNITPDIGAIAERMEGIEGMDLADGAQVDGGTVDVVLHQGETIWEIAENNGMNPEDVVQHILEDNGIDDPENIPAETPLKIRVSDLGIEIDDSANVGQEIQDEMGGEDEEVTVNPTVNAEGELGETNADTVHEEGENAFTDPFNDPMTADNATVNVNGTLGMHNANAVYDQWAQAAQKAFSTPVSVNATINVQASQSGGGVPGKARGGFVNSPSLSLIGEDGPEYVIPVGMDKHGRGMDLWMQAGHDLGVPGFADGGFVGDESMIATPFEKKEDGLKSSLESIFGTTVSNSSPDALGTLPGAIPTPTGDAGEGSSNGVSVNVNLSPMIQIDGSNMNEDEVFNVMKSRIKEVADDIGLEVGEKLTKIFGNMPLAQGV